MPAEFAISIVKRPPLTSGHDRILKVEVASAGVAIPPQSLLGIFGRDHIQRSTGVTTGREGESIHGNIAASSASEREDALVFDIVVEPLAFGVVPMGSWYTGAVVVASVIIGIVMTSVLFRIAPI